MALSARWLCIREGSEWLRREGNHLVPVDISRHALERSSSHREEGDRCFTDCDHWSPGSWSHRAWQRHSELAFPPLEIDKPKSFLGHRLKAHPVCEPVRVTFRATHDTTLYLLSGPLASISGVALFSRAASMLSVAG